MLAVLLATTLACAPEGRSVSLSNGSNFSINGEGLPYWGCFDTFISAETPDINYGGSHILEGGPTKTILIKFGDLDRAAAGYRKVLKATLFLTPSADMKGKLKAVKRVLAAWGEGPETSPFAVPNPLAKAPSLAATWKMRRAGEYGAPWQQEGLGGAADAETLSGVALAQAGQEVALTGLEQAVQKMVDRDFLNRGLALEFSGPVEFFSSESRVGKPRLELELGQEQPTGGPDLSVVSIDMSPESPKKGEEVTYTAHIKNVGRGLAQGFTGAWVTADKSRSSFEIKRALMPGESLETTMKMPFTSSGIDERANPIGFFLAPRHEDTNPSNDGLQIFPGGMAVDIRLDPATLENLGKDVNFRGSRSAEDVVQGYLTLLNEMVLPKSRFSFAPDGALARFRLRKVVPTVGTASSEDLLSGASRQIWRQALESAGLMSYEKMNRAESQDEAPSRANGLDRYPGLLGGGSTLDDIGVPPDIQLPYEPFYSPIFLQTPLEATGLLAASDVAALNDNLAAPVPGANTRGKLPSTVLARAMTMAETPLGSVTLEFYQTQDGVPAAQPTFTLKTSAEGVALLPSREGQGGSRDVFGGLQADGGNGVYKIRAEAHGASDITWLKAWQLSDALSRSGHQAVVFDLRFNLPSEDVDRSANLAKNRVVTDSADDLPAKLVGLVDDSIAKDVTLPNATGAWIELDLGRDRPVAEINLLGSTPEFWKRFDVVTYSTGTTVRSALPWVNVVDPSFEKSGSGVLSQSLRGTARLMRYVRFICNEPGAGAKLAEIQVYAAKPPSQN